MDGLAPELSTSLARDHAWVRLRLLGWLMMGLWQAADLVADVVPVMLGSRPLMVARDATGLVGLVLVAWGFERIVAEGHRRLGERTG